MFLFPIDGGGVHSTHGHGDDKGDPRRAMIHLSNDGGEISSRDVRFADGAAMQLSYRKIFDVRTTMAATVQIVELDIYERTTIIR
jgi:hypothetical protein